MWMILNTFKLSKNTLIHLFYLIFIVTNISDQTGARHIQTEEELNNAAPEYKQSNTVSLPSDADKGLPINNGNQGERPNPTVISGILDRMNKFRNSNTQTNGNEINNDVPEENDEHVADNAIENQKPDEDNPLDSILIGLNPEPTTPGELKPEKNKKKTKEEKKKGKKEKKKKKKEKKKKKKEETDQEKVNTENVAGVESATIVGTNGIEDPKTAQESDPEKNPTEITQDEINNIKPKAIEESGVHDTIEGQKLEDDATSKKLIESPKSTPGEIEPEENNLDADNDQKIDEVKPKPKSKNKKKNRKKKKKKKKKRNRNKNKRKSKIVHEQDNTEKPKIIVGVSDETVDLKTGQLSDPEKNPTENRQINPNGLTPSLLKGVGIVKIEQDLSESSEAKRKENKKKTFIEFEPTEGSARIYCTFLGDVLKMYNKVKKRFVGHFCHAIVFGTPIILKSNQVHVDRNMKTHLNKMHNEKQESLLIVVMQYSTYNDWANALHNTNKLIKRIIKTVVLYKIDGIQFSNLHPTMAHDQIDVHMMTNLEKFFEKLIKAANNRGHELKIGITIDMYSQAYTTSFTSFKTLNAMVTWYSYQTITMVTCSSDYRTTGTSPLEGEVGLRTSIDELIKNEFDMSKLVVGIQLFPNKVNELHPFTYEELCSTSKDSWDTWCAAQPEDLRLKGIFLRDIEIGGVQLFYMHSDDYRSSCGCYSFPLTRAFLGGLINMEPDTCEFFND